MELSGIAKLNDGSRLIMLLDVANLMRDQKLRDVQSASAHRLSKRSRRGNAHKTAAGARN